MKTVIRDFLGPRPIKVNPYSLVERDEEDVRPPKVKAPPNAFWYPPDEEGREFSTPLCESIIIGGGLAGLRTAEELRARDLSGQITMIAAAESAHPGLAVARMGSAVIGRILLFYVVSIFFIMCVVPWNLVRSG